MVNSAILNLVKEYSKREHIKTIPQKNSALPEKMQMIYNINWEKNTESAPYEILTQIMDCYYCLPERPDLASLFCWQAINHSYNELLLTDSGCNRLSDSKGISKLVEAILNNYSVYKDFLEPFIKNLPDKAYRYVASYVLKGYTIKTSGKEQKFYTQSYLNFTKEYKELDKVISDTFGDIMFKASNVKLDNNIARIHVDAEKNRALTRALAIKLRQLVENKNAKFEMKDGTSRTVEFEDKDVVLFVIEFILYASRCSNFHGNVASRLNSDKASENTFEMYTNIFLLEYMILAISLHIQGYITEDNLVQVKNNQQFLFNN